MSYVQGSQWKAVFKLESRFAQLDSSFKTKEHWGAEGRGSQVVREGSEIPGGSGCVKEEKKKTTKRNKIHERKYTITIEQ